MKATIEKIDGENFVVLVNITRDEMVWIRWKGSLEDYQEEEITGPIIDYVRKYNLELSEEEE